MAKPDRPLPPSSFDMRPDLLARRHLDRLSIAYIKQAMRLRAASPSETDHREDA